MMKVTAAALAGQRPLRGMKASQLEALASTATEVMFPARHRIFAAGDYADKFWLIESGYVVLDVNVPGKGLAVIGRVGIGGLLGCSRLLPPYERMPGAVCVTEVRAVEFNGPSVRECCAADPLLRGELAQRLFQVSAGRLPGTRTKLVTAEFWPLHDRPADRLAG